MTTRFTNEWTRLVWAYLSNDLHRTEKLLNRLKKIDPEAIGAQAQEIRRFFDDLNPHADDFGYSIWQDFVRHALDCVNFHEIAALLLSPKTSLEDSSDDDPR